MPLLALHTIFILFKKFKKLINSEEFLNLKFDKEYLGNSVKNKRAIVFDIDGNVIVDDSSENDLYEGDTAF